MSKFDIIYDVRWSDNREPPAKRVQRVGKMTLGDAQMEAIDKSEKFGYAEIGEIKQMQIGEVTNEEVLRRWAYMAGHETELTAADLQARKDAAIKHAQRQLTKDQLTQKGNTMDNNETKSAALAAATAGKPVTKVPAAKAGGKVVAKPAAKAVAKVAPKGKKAATTAKAPAAKTEKAPVGAPGSLLASFGLREGTNRAKMVELLVSKKGSMLPIKDVLKATYGKADVEAIGSLKMVIKGATEMIKANKIAWHIESGKDAKGDMTLGLKAGKPE